MACNVCNARFRDSSALYKHKKKCGGPGGLEEVEKNDCRVPLTVVGLKAEPVDLELPVVKQEEEDIEEFAGNCYLKTKTSKFKKFQLAINKD